ncbi:D-threo-aldose 1-dehydrogenase [Microbacterium sp. SORGH_AS 1204]|uniref:aldo/keto reductase n=1 Tax=Microbacterium sp. SORGH_AS_1204 TaxID=3041785 RepID=UPI00279175FE|nr:aldo/keto reductase [Microbacterium sp. SORGH_AS_1204]MDQ1135424.1 D-threo-aldose 1-dehydrogenase [Microbacterium sp. SORGH_AS_1204]
MTAARLNGLPLTSVGVGGAQFGNLFRETTDDETAAAIDAAWERGIRYFDTAPHYGLGLSERRMGAALRSRPRDEYVLSTKAGRLLVDNPEGEGQLDDDGFIVPATTKRVWDFSRDGVRRSIHESLERLGVDRIDIAYLHDPDAHWDAASTTGIEALRELRDEGVIGAIGVGMNQAEMPAAFIRECDIDVVMLAGRYTLLDRTAERELLPLAVEHDVAIVAAGVYNSGLLSSPEVPADARFDYSQAPAALISGARDMAALCREYGVTLPDAAVQFALRHPAVRSVVLGARTVEHVTSGVERARVEIPAELWERLDERAASLAAADHDSAR